MSDSEPIHLNHPDIPCNQFVEIVTDYLDGALAPDDLARVEEHLGICGELRHDEVEALDPTTRATLMAAFRQARS